MANGDPSEHSPDEGIDELVVACRGGDLDAMAELYRLFYAPVFGYAKFALRSREKAEDLAELAFLRAMEGLETYDPERGAFRAWLFRIARNAIVDQVREDARVVPDPVQVESRQAELVSEDEVSTLLPWITDEDLAFLVERLPDRQREVLVLRYLLDLDTEQIATIIEATPKAVRHLHTRALASLRERLGAVKERSERCKRAPTRLRVKPLPVLGARRFALESSLRPAAAFARGPRAG